MAVNQKRTNQKNKRAMYRADMKEIYKFAALINSNGIPKPCQMAAVEFLKSVVYVQKGQERRKLYEQEVTDLIERGYKLTP